MSVVFRISRARLLVLLAAMVSFALIPLALDLWATTPDEQHAAAVEKWAAQGIDHYRLLIVYGVVSECRVEAEILNEQVIASTVDGVLDCKSAPLTVGELFESIEQTDAEPTCPTGRCQCSGVVGADVQYDPTLGYPARITIYRMFEPARHSPFRIFNIEFSLDDLLHRSGCASFVSSKATVLSLTPLP